MKIAHVITRMIIGGAQENTLLSCAGQIKDGHAVDLITGPTTGPEGALLEKHPIESLGIIEVPSLLRELGFWQDWKAYKHLRKVFREGKYDVVHTHASKAGIIARAAAWKEKVPCVVHTIHGSAFHAYEKRWKNSLYIFSEKWAAKRCHHIASVCQAMINQFLAAGIAEPKKYSVVYSGMEIESFAQAEEGTRERIRKDLDIAEDAVVFCKVARLFELKGHDILMRCAEAFLKQEPKAVFIFVGDGLLRQELETEIAERNWQENFRFVGLVTPEEVPQYIHASDVLIHLSLREGLPRAVVQGLAAAKPALGLNLDGSPEVILPNKTGFLHEPDDFSGITESMLSLAQDSDLRQRLGQAGQDLVIKRFAKEKMVADLEKLYKSVLEANR